MLCLGIDFGTSAIKLTIWDAGSNRSLVTVRYPEEEAPILSLQEGWAEQSPEDWWIYLQQALRKAHASGLYAPADIKAIGISYQMHGLVLLNKEGKCLRNSIIWCDSRAVTIGEQTQAALGSAYCLEHLLNLPGNFTASKLAWVQKHEPELFRQIQYVMLPGDYISYRLTGVATTTPAALSEGMFWDFSTNQLAEKLFQYHQWSPAWIPDIRSVFGNHGELTPIAAAALQLSVGIPVTYKAGDQMNNAWSLGVLHSGEVAASAGTSGVIYAVTDQVKSDPHGRINTFAHVNHSSEKINLGLLMCINGAGILNKWIRKLIGSNYSYEQMNYLAASVAPGADGLNFFPFGNGVERMLENKLVQAHLLHIDLNRHSQAHLFRAAQEGVAFAFRYGLDILHAMQVTTNLIKAGRANLFLSDVFTEAFVQVTQTPLELYDTDGSLGAARGAAKGVGCFPSDKAVFETDIPLKRIEPDHQVGRWDELYQNWQHELIKQINNS